MFRLSLALLMLSLSAPSLYAANPDTPVSTITDFYRAYFSPATKATEPPFSKAFSAAKEMNLKNCIAYAGTDICGWGADEVIYLHTQEGDPNPLTLENSGLKAEEVSPRVVRVTLNVYPSLTDTESQKYYTRQIFYKLIQENGIWVVDDMRLAGDTQWARKMMQDENAYYRIHPEPPASQGH